MSKLILIALSFTSTLAFADGLEGRNASLTIELRALSKNNETLTVAGVIKSSEFSTGLYFEPKNKDLKLEVPKNCHSLAELSFLGGHKLTVKGELKKFMENFTTPNEVSFNEKVSVRCDVVKTAKDQ